MNNPNVKDDLLKDLRVIDRIDVGPVHLERRRLTTPYKVLDLRSLNYQFSNLKDQRMNDNISS